ncbi:sodium-independent sulfate anion transporter isoform X2 [Anser cygnoides]|uniref:sodium-independent sulfate anion transporter isoform X2 n=1 Tax=Anser cygnoides TaxID=8845 RepID=UPI0034D358BF
MHRELPAARRERRAPGVPHGPARPRTAPQRLAGCSLRWSLPPGPGASGRRRAPASAAPAVPGGTGRYRAVPGGPPRHAASPPPSPAGAAPALSHVGAGSPRAPAALLAPGAAEAAAGPGLAAPLLAGLAAARPDRRRDRGPHGGAAGAGVRRGGRPAPAGFLLDFISCPVIKGFTSAASITISFNQVKNILGLHGIPRQFFLQVYETLRRIGETRPGDAILGLACLATLAGLRAMKSCMPPAARTEPLATRASYLIVWTCATARNALVVLFAGLVAYCFQLRGSQPLTLTGSIPRGLPPCRLPPFSKAVPNGTVPFGTMVEDMGVGLAVVPLMGLVETVAIAKAFASQNDYRIDPNQELLAMGFANVLGSFFSSYPVTGSFGRTAVNAQTGVCTPAGGLVTGALVLLSLAYLTSLFYYIPKAALAAVIISAVVPMFDAGIFRTLWRVKRLDLVPLCVTFLLCFWEVQYGIVAGVLVSGVLLLYSIARPPLKVSGQGTLLVQPGSSLHFPAIEHLRDVICSRALSAPSPCSIILDCHRISSIDYTVVAGLAELLQELRKHGISLAFCGLQDQVLRALLAADLEGFRHFPSWEEAERCSGAGPGGSGAAPFDSTSTSESSLLPTGLIQ